MADTRDVQVGAALRHVTDGLASLIFTTTVLILPDGLFPGDLAARLRDRQS